MSQQRVIVESVRPSVDGGRHPVKRVVGDTVHVSAVIYADGHDVVRARVRVSQPGAEDETSVRLEPHGNDVWSGTFTVERMGTCEFRVEAWIDHFGSWVDGFEKKMEVDAASPVDLAIGADLVKRTAARADGDDAKRLGRLAATLADESKSIRERASAILAPAARTMVATYPDRAHATVTPTTYRVTVDPPLAGFSSWYEVFPRSLYGEKAGHGTFRDLEARLGYIAEMGFSVLYLPPIHPIGTAFRKGRNNALVAQPDDPGSPWAVGSSDGGHTAIHSQLGTLADFRSLVSKAAERDLAIALDIAFQCSPDHPWVTEHPEWFVQRPDGTIQYAENPPKKYQDIYPINFESDDWEALWHALRDVFLFWIDEGVTVFRVDNPHTKSFPFWEWCIAEIKEKHPEAIFLAEAFTRPHRMHGLAKRGFTQSYTYFTWRTRKWEIESYLRELTEGESIEYLRPNFWPNTPDILHEYLQEGGRPGFLIRLVLAATLSPNYGIYGPAFELQEASPREPGSEEYLDSEKYEIRRWDTDDPTSIAPWIRRINEIRNEFPALQQMHGLRFHATDNDQIIAYSRRGTGKDEVILVVVNLSYEHTHSAWVEFSPVAVGLRDSRPFVMDELMSSESYTWEGYWNFVQLDPFQAPAQIFRVRLD